MARCAGAISAARLGERLPEDGVPRELRGLAAAFNQNLERLEDWLAAALADLLGARLAGQDAETTDRHIEEAIMWQLPRVDRYVWVLDTAVTLAPLMGLLGTIIGMVHAFDTLGTAGATGGATQMVTGGIAKALVVTDAGLFIAILAVLFLNDFNKRIRLAVHRMDLLKVMVINRMHGGGSAHQGMSVKEAHSGKLTAIAAHRGQ